ncbi:MAG: ferritin family protein [Candidatus Binatia bacterium]
MKLSNTLEECADLERRIAGFYEQFASLWSEQREVAEMWQAMAAEERGHAAALEELASHLAPSRRRGYVDREAIAQLRGYVTGTGRIVGTISLDEAFRIALDLESFELHQVYLQVIELARQEPTLPARALAECLARLGPHEAPLLALIEGLAEEEELRERASQLRRELRF